MIMKRKNGSGGFNKGGYWRITVNGKRFLEHRYIMEQFLKRPLSDDEHIHHINGIKTDNRIDNLRIVSEHFHMGELHKNSKKYCIDWSEVNIPQKRNRWTREPLVSQCVISGCNNKYHQRGLCQRHYDRWIYYTTKK